MQSNQYYVAIDLGSNSFHMLIVRVVVGSIRIIAKVKRRIRLAEGLLADGTLEPSAQQRALDCLSLFADRIQGIHPNQIRVVGTATLRKLAATDPFITQMETTLGLPIQIISGLDEAHFIYQGIAHTTEFSERLLVCDIGGASTEIAIGHTSTAEASVSLDMGCVAWKTKFFPQNKITKQAVEAAIQAAEQLIHPHIHLFHTSPHTQIYGASGTFKTLQHIARNRGLSESIHLSMLEELCAELLNFEQLDEIQLEDLPADRALVLLPGLCILIALFKQLGFTHIDTTEAALREGLIYSLLPPFEQPNIQQSTLERIAKQYHADLEQSQRVYQTFKGFYSTVEKQAHFPQNALALAKAVAYLHEVGLNLSYKQASQHSHYLLRHTNLPGFTPTERQALLELLKAVTGIIDESALPAQLPSDPTLNRLARLIRISVLACQKRTPQAVAVGRLEMNEQDLPKITLFLPPGFLAKNPFLASLLQEESRYQQSFGGFIIQESSNSLSA